MAVYSFANCILDKAPFLTPFATVSSSVMNMRTEGILRLLSGETIAMHPEDKAALIASPQWLDFVKRYNVERHPRLQTFDVFQPLKLEGDDAFFWSPFADSLCPFTTARSTTGDPFPCICDPINIFFLHGARMDFSHCEKQWMLLADRLSHLRKKAVLLYPPDNIRPPAFEAKHAEELREHISRCNARAAEIFEPKGWKIFSPFPVLSTSYWAHYREDVLDALKLRVEEFLRS